MKLTVVNWEKFNPRKDLKRPSWFRFENEFFVDPDFFDLDNGSKLVWIYLLCEASRRNREGKIDINVGLAASILKLEQTHVSETIKILIEMSVIRPGHEHDPAAIRTSSDENVPLRDETKRNETRRDETGRDDNETRRGSGGIDSGESTRSPPKPVDQKSDSEKKYKFDAWDETTAVLMRDAFLEVNPDAKIAKKANIHQWANEFRLMRERDKIDAETIEKVLDWVFKDEFWRVTLKTPGGLRKNWDTITGQMRRKRSGRQQSVRDVVAEAHRIIDEEDGGGPFGDVLPNREVDDPGPGGDMGEVFDVGGVDARGG